MGCSLNCWRRTIVDVIPEKEVMYNWVDAICKLEDALKMGVPLSDRDKKDLKRVRKIAAEMKNVTNRL